MQKIIVVMLLLLLAGCGVFAKKPIQVQLNEKTDLRSGEKLGGTK